MIPMFNENPPRAKGDMKRTGNLKLKHVTFIRHVRVMGSTHHLTETNI